MSLSGLKKDVLIQIAEEINVELPSPPRVLALKEAIVNSDLYKNNFEEFESIVEMVKGEIKEREERELFEREERERVREHDLLERERVREHDLLERERIREHDLLTFESERVKLAQLEKQLELEKIKSESRSKLDEKIEYNGDLNSSNNLENLLKSVKTLTMQLPSRSESYNIYFQSLERAFQIKSVPEEYKAEILLNILGEKATNIIVHMTAEDLAQYSKVKEAVLKEFQSSPQDVLNDFRRAQKFRDETYIQFSSRLSATFDYYCQLREVSDFKSLCELIVSDKLFSTLDKELQLHVGVKQAEKWFKPHDMSKCIDIYVSSCRNGKTETVSYSRGTGAEANKSNKFNCSKYVSKTFVSEVKAPNCVLCKNVSHYLNQCPEFKKLSVKERVAVVQNHKLCYNCFSKHKVSSCKSKLQCGVCKRKHHIYLHYTEQSEDNRSAAVAENQLLQGTENFNPSAQEFIPRENNPYQTEVKTFAATNPKDLGSKLVLLSTATIQVADKFGRYHAARALLDNGSQSCFVSRRFVKKLDLKLNKQRVVVSGLNNSTSVVDTSIKAKISNRDGSYERVVELLVVPNITDFAPTQYFEISHLQLENIRLADENFNNPGEVDILLGAQVFLELLKPGRFKPPGSELILQNSVFGFLCGGSVEVDSSPVVHCGLILEDLDKTMRKFWETEHFDLEGEQGEEAIFCEDHFIKTHYRDEGGRYVVSLPVKEDINLGDSIFMANKRLSSLLKRLDKNKEFAILYQEFLSEYEHLGHMEVTTSTPKYVMPHHGVLRPGNTSTKLRVVFNASAITSSGYSLNDFLKMGDIPQEDLFSILLRFREHRFVMTADVVKMYRQIWVNPLQTDLQCILWRKDSEIKLYKLLTVSYGTKSAPYLATRVLKQLCIDEEEKFPLAARAAKRDFYVDDILTGADKLEDARALQVEMISLLKAGGMELHKWSSNEPSLLQSVKTRSDQVSFDKLSTDTIKTLGLTWHPGQDHFAFSTDCASGAVTKRSVLSQISRLFDPLGLLGPILIKAKIFIQRLWLLKLSWDEKLPAELHNEWNRFSESLSSLDTIYVPRRILIDCVQEIHLIGFCDASKDGFGAVIYTRSISKDGECKVSLLCSKSRVSPIAKPLSIPRLELCGAELLSRLVVKVIASLSVNIDHVFLYCDSTTVLAWIRSSPSSYKVFVANRVSKIQELSKTFVWNYVSTKNNPADLVSRGVWPGQLHNLSLWWKGPEFIGKNELTDDSSVNLKVFCDDKDYTKELKKLSQDEVKDNLTLFSTNNDCTFNITNSYLKLIRIYAFVFRFIDNCKGRVLSGPLQKSELERSKKFILKLVQAQHFSKELRLLADKKPLKESNLNSLALFLDQDGLIRVGGRLENSDLPLDAKHPVLLPKGHKLTEMIFRYYHLRNLHCGPQTLLHSVRQEYWAISGRDLARRIVHSCVTCFKANPKEINQIMAPLPKDRIIVSHPFSKTGLDLCGHFLIKFKNQRKGIYQKVFVCIFVCLVTKAVHLEVLSDLTAEALIACLKRFISRRGLPTKLLSDNAKNFCKAASEIRKVLALFKQESVSDYLCSQGISWGFIPPQSPNFGGLWEAGVKSFKYHLKRCVGEHKLTFEEFLTITTQIEAMLNSRPLTPMSSDPNDFSALTAGHFLIGRPLNALPQSDVSDIQTNRLSRWQLISKLSQTIWKRWSLDYLANLQQRSKWQVDNGNAAPGMVVLLKENGLPICTWKIGRICNVTPGKDGKVRVVEVKTQTGTYKRGISNICILPICDNQV